MFVSCRCSLSSRPAVRQRSAVRNCHLKDTPPEVSHPKGNPPRVSFPKICSQRQPSEGLLSENPLSRQPSEGLLSENMLSEATLRRSTVRGPDRKEDTPRRHAAPDTRGGGCTGKAAGSGVRVYFFKVTIFSAKSCIPDPIFRPSAIHQPNYQSLEFSTSLRFRGRRTSRRRNRVNAALKPRRSRLGAHTARTACPPPFSEASAPHSAPVHRKIRSPIAANRSRDLFFPRNFPTFVFKHPAPNDARLPYRPLPAP